MEYTADMSGVRVRVPMCVANRYRSAVIKEVKLHAFDGTTSLLKKGRQLLIDLVLDVERWHEQQGHERLYPTDPGYQPSDKDAEPPPPSIWARPFRWNGRELYRMLVFSLDFLVKFRPLVDCFGEDFAWSVNPFAIACGKTLLRETAIDHSSCDVADVCLLVMILAGLRNRPTTPRKKTRQVKIAGKDVQVQISKAALEERLAEIGNMKAWLRDMQNTADWWPSIAPEFCNLESEEVKRLRVAEKALMGTLLAEDARKQGGLNY